MCRLLLEMSATFVMSPNDEWQPMSPYHNSDAGSLVDSISISVGLDDRGRSVAERREDQA